MLDSFNLQPPNFGPMQPVYPALDQLLRTTGATVVGPVGGVPTLYLAFTEQLSSVTLEPVDREQCLVDDINQLGLPAGYYLGRLAGQFTPSGYPSSLPVYEVINPVVGGNTCAPQYLTTYREACVNGVLTVYGRLITAQIVSGCLGLIQGADYFAYTNGPCNGGLVLLPTPSGPLGTPPKFPPPNCPPPYVNCPPGLYIDPYGCLWVWTGACWCLITCCACTGPSGTGSGVAPCVPGVCSLCTNPPASWLLLVAGFTDFCVAFNQAWTLLPYSPCEWVAAGSYLGLYVQVILEIAYPASTISFTYWDGDQITASATYSVLTPSPLNCCLPMVFAVLACNCATTVNPGSGSAANPCLVCPGLTPSTWNVTLTGFANCYAGITGTVTLIQVAPCQWEFNSATLACVLFVQLIGTNITCRFGVSNVYGAATVTYAGVITDCCATALLLFTDAFCPTGPDSSYPSTVTLIPLCGGSGLPNPCPAALTATPTCCGGSGSSGSFSGTGGTGGGPGGVMTCCCPGNPLNTTIKLAFGGGTAWSLSGTFVILTYQAGTINPYTWSGVDTTCGITWEFNCHSNELPCFFDFGAEYEGSPGIFDKPKEPIVTCGPCSVFLVEFTSTAFEVSGAAPGCEQPLGSADQTYTFTCPTMMEERPLLLRQEALTPPVPANLRRGSCIHLGDDTGRTVQCGSCQGHVEVKVKKCAVFGECTIARPVDGLMMCAVCPRYKSEEVTVNQGAGGIGDGLLGLCAIAALKRDKVTARVVYRCGPNAIPFVRLFIGPDSVEQHDWDQYGSLALTTGDLQMNAGYLNELHTHYPRPRWERYAENVGTKDVVIPDLHDRDGLLAEGVPYAGRVVLSPFADLGEREWPLDNWLALEKLLTEAGLQVLVIDSRQDRAVRFTSDKLLGALPQKVAGAMLQSRCVVSNDSGMAHLAGMLKVSAVTIGTNVDARKIHGIYPQTICMQGAPWGEVTPEDVLARILSLGATYV